MVTHGGGPAQAPHDLPPPWFNVRLTFADGAWIDVLAVVDGERLAIEDLRADPPLPLDSFAELAGRIEDPLGHACGVPVRQPALVAPEPPDGAASPPERHAGSGGAWQPRSAAPERAAGRSDGPTAAPGWDFGPEAAPRWDFGPEAAPRWGDAPAGAPLSDRPTAAQVSGFDPGGPPPWVSVPSAAPGWDAVPGAAPVSGDPRAGAASPARRRARPAVPRGRGGRRIAADAYRAAQQDGRDPVLAVMGATGHSRRKALRLIAGARDEGYLPPRRTRRRSNPAQAPVTSSASG